MSPALLALAVLGGWCAVSAALVGCWIAAVEGTRWRARRAARRLVLPLARRTERRAEEQAEKLGVRT